MSNRHSFESSPLAPASRNDPKPFLLVHLHRGMLVESVQGEVPAMDAAHRLSLAVCVDSRSARDLRSRQLSFRMETRLRAISRHSRSARKSSNI